MGDIRTNSGEYAWRYLLQVYQATGILETRMHAHGQGEVQGSSLGTVDVGSSRVAESVLVDLVVFRMTFCLSR